MKISKGLNTNEAVEISKGVFPGLAGTCHSRRCRAIPIYARAGPPLPSNLYCRDKKNHRDQQLALVYRKPAYYAAQNIASIFDATVVRIPDYWVPDSVGFDQRGGVQFFGYQKEDTDMHLVTGWLKRSPATNGNASDSNTTQPHSPTFNHQFENPVYVDLRTGIIYEIPDSAYSHENGNTEFRDIPLYDSPILIAGGEFFLSSTNSVNPVVRRFESRFPGENRQPTRVLPIRSNHAIQNGVILYDIRGRMLNPSSVPHSAGSEKVFDQVFIAVPAR